MIWQLSHKHPSLFFYPLNTSHCWEDIICIVCVFKKCIITWMLITILFLLILIGEIACESLQFPVSVFVVWEVNTGGLLNSNPIFVISVTVIVNKWYPLSTRIIKKTTVKKIDYCSIFLHLRKNIIVLHRKQLCNKFLTFTERLLCFSTGSVRWTFIHLGRKLPSIHWTCNYNVYNY